MSKWNRFSTLMQSVRVLAFRDIVKLAVNNMTRYTGSVGGVIVKDSYNMQAKEKLSPEEGLKAELQEDRITKVLCSNSKNAESGGS